MRRPWLLIGGVIVLLVGVVGLVLPILPGIAFLILGGLMIRSSMTGEPVQFPRLGRRRPDPLPDAAEG